VPTVDLALLRRLENTWYADFATCLRRDYGLLFHEPSNPLSYDANHAVITDLGADLDAAVRDVSAFYAARGLEPRLYSAFLPGDAAALRPVLERHGFVYRSQALHWYVWDAARLPPAPQAGAQEAAAHLTVQRETALSRGLRELLHSDGPAPWTEATLRRHLRCPTLHLLVGRLDGIPVTMAAIKMMDGLSRVDDVLTHPLYRRRGYAHALMSAAVRYHAAHSAQPLYLYAENPTAIRIYEAVGFDEEILPFDQWSAWRPAGRGP